MLDTVTRSEDPKTLFIVAHSVRTCCIFEVIIATIINHTRDNRKKETFRTVKERQNRNKLVTFNYGWYVDITVDIQAHMSGPAMFRYDTI